MEKRLAIEKMTEHVRAEYYNDFASKVFQLRSEGWLCDIDVHVGEKVYKCHRLILCSASEYFHHMFTMNFLEGSSSKIILRDIEANVFEEILRFMYTGKAMLSNSNLIDIIRAAEYYKLPLLIKHCIVFMKKNFSDIPAEVIRTIFISYARFVEQLETIEKMTEFVRAEYYDDFASKVHQFRLEDWLCDIDVRVGERIFKCHRLILGSASEYFHLMFTSNFLEASTSKVILRDIEASVFEEILRFIYTGQAMLSNSNLSEVIRAAEFYRLSFLIEYCIVFMEKNFSDILGEVILTIFSHARCVAMKQLVEFVGRHIYENFDNYSNVPEFAELSFDDLLQILELVDGQPAVPIQDPFIKGILVWITHQVNLNPGEKKSYSDRLIKTIDFTKLSAQFTEHGLPKLMKVLAASNHSIDYSIQTPNVLQRCPNLLRAYVSCFSRSANEVLPGTSVYTGFSSSSPSKWIYSGDLEFRFNRMKNVVIDDLLYSFRYSSGLCGNFPQQTFSCSSSISMYPYTRLSLPPFMFDEEFDLCGTGNEIYIHSKWIPQSLLYSQILSDENSAWSRDELQGMFYYKRDIDRWFPLPCPELPPRGTLKTLTDLACMTCDDERLYLVGGAGRGKIIQAYDRRTRRWSQLSRTSESYMKPSCGIYGKDIIIIGAADSPKIVEMYDPKCGRTLRLRNSYTDVHKDHYLINWSDQFSRGTNTLACYYWRPECDSKIMRMDTPLCDHVRWLPLPNLHNSLLDRDLRHGCRGILDMISF